MKKSIIEYFKDTAERYPENIAVSDEQSSYTYKEIAEISGCIATEIAKTGIHKKPVVILSKRDIKLPAAMLGVLSSGNFYVVLDYESPSNRIEKILNTLSPAAIIYEKELENNIISIDTGIRKLCFEDITEKHIFKQELIDFLQQEISSSDIAYILFTSGSTGTPKGAVVTHMNVICYISWFIKCFGIDNTTKFGSQTSLYFSMSVSDFYGSIFTGATYNIIPKEYFTFPAKLISFLDERKINTLYWVPTAMGLVAKFDLFRYSLPHYLQKVMFAGEVMPCKYLNYWKKYLPDVLYANLFGPTETTDICAYYKIDRNFSDSDILPIGFACDDCELIIINENGKPAQTGELGELYVKSSFVVKGYFRNKEKTEEAFIQNPLHNDYPDIVYKTGDLVHKNEKGELIYSGRKDFQIKHLGYRIELSEIESVLNTIDKVELTVCFYDKNSDSILLAYESLKKSDEDIKDAAEHMLPYYMRPTKFMRFSVFPKNQNGKIDRKEILKKF